MPAAPRSRRREDFYRDRRRRKVCAFCADKTVQIDYKEVNRLRRYLSERAKTSTICPSDRPHLILIHHRPTTRN